MYPSNSALFIRFFPQAGIATVLLGSIALANGAAWASGDITETPQAPFNESTLEDWKERSFSGNSTYELVEKDGSQVLQGSTDGAASILYKEKTINLNETPVFNWSWKIQDIYENIEEQTRKGDDFPARLYVVAKTGLLPWQTLAINYVWSSNQAMGEIWPNPFTKKAKMVVVQTGKDNAGQWVSQSRNIADDFKELFGREVDKIDGYAVMVDGDNANKKGTAWFADIRFEAK